MTEHVFGSVKVLESGKTVVGKSPDAVIRFISHRLSVEEAETFALDLLAAIEKGRQIIRDPI
jgi:hypothetical protein